jgi:phosphoribosylformylglycinamidine cyclo-ligase
MPAVFELIHQIGQVSYDEMIRTFNLGVGMILIVDKRSVDTTLRILRKKKGPGFVLGEIV